MLRIKGARKAIRKPVSYSRYFERYSKVVIVVISLLLTVLVGFGDYLAGPEISFSIFYVLPVAVASWYGSRTAGFLIAMAAAGTLNIVEMMSGVQHSHPLIVYWNAAASLGMVVILAYLFSNLRERLQKERELADTDSLTQACNRRRFYQHAENEIQRAQRYRHPFTIAYIDLDDFKIVNDSYGHETGDDLLRTVVSVMNDNARETDIVARLGGDEFAILFIETGSQTAASALEKIRAHLMMAMQRAGWPVTFSIGMVTYEAAPTDVRQVLRQVDEMMYVAKKNGKNRIIHVTSSADIMAHDKVERRAG